jgi:hypothetical protein
MNSRGLTIFWDLTPCSPVDVHRRFGGTFCFHCCQILGGFLLGLFFEYEDGGSVFLGNVGELSDYTSQKAVVFKSSETAIRMVFLRCEVPYVSSVLRALRSCERYCTFEHACQLYGKNKSFPRSEKPSSNSSQCV